MPWLSEWAGDFFRRVGKEKQDHLFFAFHQAQKFPNHRSASWVKAA